MKYEINHIVLWIGNLFAAGALFLYVCKRKRSCAGRTGNGQRGCPARGAGLAGAVELLLEFAVYSAGMMRLMELILGQIEAAGEGSLMMSGVWILSTESMLVLFLVVSVLYARRKVSRTEQGFGAFIREEGEWGLAMILLLVLILGDFRKMDPWRVLGLLLMYLLLFFVLLWLKRNRHRAGARGEAGEWRQVSGGQEEDTIRQQRQAEYLKNVDIQYQRTRELWHDLKNHIGVLEILAEEGKLEELSDYLKSFKRDVEIRMIPTRTGCTAVDAILSDKLYYARRKEIEVSMQVCNLSEMAIPALELCAILGNLLDNAIEACGRLPGKGRIMLRLKQQENFYYLTVINTAPEPVRKGEGYVSGKKDCDNGVGHGLGLRSVERIAHQYGGSMVTDYGDGEFKVVVRIQDGVPLG